MAKNKKPAQTAELDGVFVFKIVLYVVLGSLWLKLQTSTTDSHLSFPIPVGLIVGLLFASHEHFQIDRKIEYAVLIVATLIGLMVPYGIFIGL
jgi:multisubunit Na+/H+ antiporter MnhE subunit